MSPNGDKGKRPATEFDDKLDPRGKTGKRLTILSIDGGGVRGIIPAKILQRLEIYLASEVKKLAPIQLRNVDFSPIPHIQKTGNSSMLRLL